MYRLERQRGRERERGTGKERKGGRWGIVERKRSTKMWTKVNVLELWPNELCTAANWRGLSPSGSSTISTLCCRITGWWVVKHSGFPMGWFLSPAIPQLLPLLSLRCHLPKGPVSSLLSESTVSVHLLLTSSLTGTPLPWSHLVCMVEPYTDTGVPIAQIIQK